MPAVIRAAPPGMTDPAPDGLVVVDKPNGWTSHDVVGRTRRLARTRKVGHAGTLDPMATGVLPLVIGRATRLAQFYTRNDKSYRATVWFGFATDSYDSDGKALSEAVPFVMANRVAGEGGFEPPIPVPKTGALPLGHSPAQRRLAGQSTIGLNRGGSPPRRAP